ncbi:hypothetical protein EAO28_05800 [Klebsiella pneumoniae]|uniref:ABC-transporter extension domain-containing protein n=1 Tax=Klebsiella pneumoniae TaxID=573 RepID=A0A3P2EJA2_KLEPN|nr:hypothetical protein EAO28_05800 [Klebsiella pneumoniae]
MSVCWRTTPRKAQIADLQSFVSRFSANASKSRQATSRARQIDKIKLEEVKASSRQNPFIRFEQDKKLFRNALEVEALTKGFDEGPLFKTSTCCWKWAKRSPFWAPTAWVNPPC